ncbi:MAG: response regulator [Gemmatimonadetes bacterium]|nr:MAG: response regulator [Gemmatimonadota bacterium]
MAIHRIRRSRREDSSTPKPKVMIIDDDFTLRNALKISLRDDYDVVACASGDEGLAKLTDQFDTVILDIKMPGKNGFQVYDEIKRVYHDLPIIFYSAFQDIMESSALRRQYKPFGYVDKNGDSAALLDLVKKAVAHHQHLLKIKKTINTLKSTSHRN